MPGRSRTTVQVMKANKAVEIRPPPGSLQNGLHDEPMHGADDKAQQLLHGKSTAGQGPEEQEAPTTGRMTRPSWGRWTGTARLTPMGRAEQPVVEINTGQKRHATTWGLSCIRLARCSGRVYCADFQRGFAKDVAYLESPKRAV
jgi:hypothetical protein